MALYYFSALASFILSFGLIWLFKNYANKKKIFLTEIRERDIHTKPTPRVGGIGIVISFLLVALVAYVINPEILSFVDEKVLGIDRNFFGLILALLILSSVNIVDDYKSVAWPTRLTVQIVAAIVVVSFGIKIQLLNNPFGDLFILSDYVSAIFVVGWLVVLANVVNWLDSTDGLVGGVSAISLAVLFFLSVGPEVAQSQNALIAAIAFGSVIGFLPHNFSGNKAFLGDTGTMFLGFLIGVIAIISGGKIATAFLVLAIPLLDALVVITGRLIRKKSPFKADKSHLPHRLLDMGLKVWQVNAIYYTLTISFGLIALNTETIGKIGAAVLSLIVMTALVLLYSGKIKFNKVN